jgi:hypothetical protein
MGEVELGGLEEEGNGPAFGPADDEYHLFDRDEVRIYIYIPYLMLSGHVYYNLYGITCHNSYYTIYFIVRLAPSYF